MAQRSALKSLSQYALLQNKSTITAALSSVYSNMFAYIIPVQYVMIEYGYISFVSTRRNPQQTWFLIPLVTGDQVLVSRTPGTGPVSVTDDYDDDDLTLLQVGFHQAPQLSAKSPPNYLKTLYIYIVWSFMISDHWWMKITWYYCWNTCFKPRLLSL